MSTHYKPLNDGREKRDKKPTAKQKPPAVFSQMKFMEKRRLKQLDWTKTIRKYKPATGNKYKYETRRRYNEMLRANKSKTKKTNME